MTEVKLFQFEAQPVRTVIIEGKPHWVAADVCRVLGHTEASKIVKGRLEQDEFLAVDLESDISTTNRTLHKTRLVVTESGLYSLILWSHKPEARRFRRWVTSEVLPQIRETGKYAPVPALPTHLETAKQLVAALERVEELKPKAEAHEIRGGEEVNRVTNIIRHRLGLTASTLSNPRMWDKLRDIGALHPGSRLVTDEWIENGWAGNNYSTPVFTPEGVNEIERRMRKLRLVS